MGLVKIHVSKRQTTGKNENRRTRAAGHIPAVIYGNDREATNVQLDTHEFTRVLQKAMGRSVIFDVSLEGEDENPLALMRDLQRHPVTDEIYHVDLFEIPRGVPVEVEVQVVPQGEPQAVRFNEAEVIQLLNTVTVRCRPREVPEQLTIDISELEINDSRFVKDLETPAGEIVTDPEQQLLVVKTLSLFGLEDEEAEGEAAEGEAAEGEGADDESSSDED
jgi:large subunit ribosomal protein L25